MAYKQPQLKSARDGKEMWRALALIVVVLFLTIHATTAGAQRARPNKTVGVVMVVPPTGHLARNGWFTGTSRLLKFDLRQRY
jgi:hypothetical protein